MTVVANVSESAVDAMPLEQLEARMVALSSQIAGATCEFLLLVGEYDAAEGWRHWGMSSAAAWLSWHCGLGRSAAREHVRVARALREFPQLVEPFRNGQLSFSKVRAITRDLTEATLETMLEWAINATAQQIERICAGRRRSLRGDQARAQHAARSLAWRWDDDGMLVGSFKLPREEGVRFLQALEVARDVLGEVPDEVEAAEIDAAQPRCVDHEGLPAEPTELDRMLEREAAARPERRQRRSAVDALMEMAERAVAAIAASTDADDEGAGLPGLGAERFTLVMHTSASAEATKRTPGTTAGLFAAVMLADGVVRLPEEVTRRLACDCTYAEQIDDVHGNPLHLGRKTRRIRGRLAKAVHARDGGRCRAPGCSNRTTQIHHIVHWSNGGPTCIENLISLCDRHHWLVHEGGWRITGPQGAWRFHSPENKVVPMDPVRRPPIEPLTFNPAIRADAVTSKWGPQRFNLSDAVAVLDSADRRADSHTGGIDLFPQYRRAL